MAESRPPRPHSLSTAFQQIFHTKSLILCTLRLTRAILRATLTLESGDDLPMAKRQGQLAQILLFEIQSQYEDQDDTRERPSEPRTKTSPTPAAEACPVAISGSFRKDLSALQRDFQELQDLGCPVLSPTNVSVAREDSGFVFMQGEESSSPESIEIRHLDAIQAARFLWLHAPEGYVGPTASFELGFACANGIPIFTRSLPTNSILSQFVTKVESADEALFHITSRTLEPPAPAIRSFQHYYKRAALQRGYENESARDCLLLMIEEIGEFARALRKDLRIVRHSSGEISNQEAELADIFLYVIHMANVIDIDLAEAVKSKEATNIRRYLESLANA